MRFVEDLCWTVAHESAHSFGLLNHVVSCTDPMTYVQDFCGRKYFRNTAVKCGENFVEGPPYRDCVCSGSEQNSHSVLSQIFSPGTPHPAPEIHHRGALCWAPMFSNNFVIAGSGNGIRGVQRFELYINGWGYGEAEGHAATDNSPNFIFRYSELTRWRTKHCSADLRRYWKTSRKQPKRYSKAALAPPILSVLMARYAKLVVAFGQNRRPFLETNVFAIKIVLAKIVVSKMACLDVLRAVSLDWKINALRDRTA